MDLVVYVMLTCMYPTLAPSVNVCHIAHIYTEQTDCDTDAARLVRKNKRQQPTEDFDFHCTEAIKVRSERMPEAWTQ